MYFISIHLGRIRKKLITGDEDSGFSPIFSVLDRMGELFQLFEDNEESLISDVAKKVSLRTGQSIVYEPAL